MLKTLIFDFDGTIADCKVLHQEGFRQAVLDQIPDAVFSDEDVEGRPTVEKIKILTTMGYKTNHTQLNDTKQLHTQLNLYRYITFNQELYDEMSRLSEKYSVCLATNATDAFIYRSLDILQLNGIFDRVNTATDFPAKPDNTMLMDCMKFTGSTPDSTAIFEDSPLGIACAHSTGAQVIEVTGVDDTIARMKLL